MKAITTTIAILICVIGQATVWRVNNNPNYVQGTGGPCGELDVCEHCFTDLQEAIDCSSVLSGDTIYVEASGNSYGQISLDKKLTLLGAGYLLDINPGNQCNNLNSILAYLSFQQGSSGSKISGLFISQSGSSNNGRVYFGGSSLDNITVERCFIEDDVSFTTTGVVYNNISFVQNVILDDILETLSSNSEDIFGLRIENNYIGGQIDMSSNVSATGLIVNNTIGGDVNINAGLNFLDNLCSSTNIEFAENNNSLINVHHNAFSGPIPLLFSDATNPAELGQTYMFPDFGNPDDIESSFTPSPGCDECQDGGTDGGMMGAYGGLTPYQRAGLPPIPSIFEKSNTTATYEGGTIEVVVSSKINN